MTLCRIYDFIGFDSNGAGSVEKLCNHYFLVCGPRASPESAEIPQDDVWLRVEGYVPNLYKHLAAFVLSVSVMPRDLISSGHV